jgi:hypothetical protein
MVSVALFLVLERGLEPPRITPLVPKTNAATNYATPAFYIRNKCLFLNAAPELDFKYFSKPTASFLLSNAPYQTRLHGKC